MAVGDFWEVPPHPLSWPTSSPRIPAEVQELPEVIRLRGQGWVLAPDAPVWAFLPAIWPDDLRTWVHDRATAYAVSYTTDCHGEVTFARTVLSDDEIEDLERTLAELAQMAGFAGRPGGRIWLLRPIGVVSPQEVCDIAQRRVGPEFLASTFLATTAQAVVDDILGGGSRLG